MNSMVTLLGLLVLTGQCKSQLFSETCGALFATLPTNLLDPLNIPGGCVWGSCGVSIGYGALICDALCEAALYRNGTCSQVPSSTVTGQCECNSGTLLSQALLLNSEVCATFCGCACASCNYTSGGTCNVQANGVQCICNPNP